MLNGIDVFVAVVEAGGFTAAAKQLGKSTSFVSKEVTRLENRLGTRLLNRTTRSISLTDVGRLYFQQCRQIVADALDAERSVGDSHATPRGILKISAPISLGLSYLADMLPEFAERYPDVSYDLDLNDRLVDVVLEGFDVVLRVGNLDDSSLIARQIGASHGRVVASPDYWARHGKPRYPSDLAKYSCMGFSLRPAPNRWIFHDHEQPFSVDVKTRLQCNSGEMEMSLAIAGLGVTRLPDFICAKELEKGRLEAVLDEFQPPPRGIYAIYPHRRHLSPKVRMFVDFLVERFDGVRLAGRSHTGA